MPTPQPPSKRRQRWYRRYGPATDTLPPVRNNAVNDFWASATDLVTDSGTLTGSNIGATIETGELGAPTNYHTVWWKFTPSTNRTFRVDTFGSSFDTVLEVFTGSAVNALTQVAFNDDAGSTTQSEVYVGMTAGTTYYIRVRGRLSTHTGSITLTWQTAPPPANDDFANATVITGDTGTLTGQTFRGATVETGEPNPVDPVWGYPTPLYSLWYKYTPADSGMTALTWGNDYGVFGGVYTGATLTTLTQIAASRSSVSFYAIAGTTYYIQLVGSYFVSPTTHWDPDDTVTFGWTLTPAPANDLFANAEALTPIGTPLAESGTTLNATAETGEPHGSYTSWTDTETVWYKITPTVDSYIRIDLIGDASVYDTSITAWDGSVLTALTEIVSDFEFIADSHSMIEWAAAAGVTYYIQVSGRRFSGTTAGYTIMWTVTDAPANNNWANALDLVGTSGTDTGSTRGATWETGEPDPGRSSFVPLAGTVWFKWTATSNGFAVFSTQGSGFDAVLAAYVGSSLAGLTLRASNVHYGTNYARLRLYVTAGTTYYIQLYGYYGGAYDYGTYAGVGDYTLLWAFAPYTGAWTPIADMPAHGDSGVACAHDGRIYISQLWTDEFGATGYPNMLEYDPATDTYTDKAAPPSPVGTYGVAPGAYWAGIFYVLDIYDGTNLAYDIDADTWSTIATLPHDAYDGMSVAIAGKIYVIGGYQYVGPPTYWEIHGRTQIYDIATDTWSAGADCPINISYGAISTFAGKVYIIGGYAGSGSGDSDSIYEYDPATDTWTLVDTMPFTIEQPGFALVGSNLYFVGGYKGTANTQQTAGWSPAGPVSDDPYPFARWGLTGAAIGDELFMFGGSDSDTGEAADSWKLATTPAAGWPGSTPTGGPAPTPAPELASGTSGTVLTYGSFSDFAGQYDYVYVTWPPPDPGFTQTDYELRFVSSTGDIAFFQAGGSETWITVQWRFPIAFFGHIEARIKGTFLDGSTSDWSDWGSSTDIHIVPSEVLTGQPVQTASVRLTQPVGAIVVHDVVAGTLKNGVKQEWEQTFHFVDNGYVGRMHVDTGVPWPSDAVTVPAGGAQIVKIVITLAAVLPYSFAWTEMDVGVFRATNPSLLTANVFPSLIGPVAAARINTAVLTHTTTFAFNLGETWRTWAAGEQFVVLPELLAEVDGGFRADITFHWEV